MANLLRKEVKRPVKGTSPKPRSKPSPRKNTLPPPEPSVPVRPQEHSTYHNLVRWLKKLFGTGK